MDIWGVEVDPPRLADWEKDLLEPPNWDTAPTFQPPPIEPFPEVEDVIRTSDEEHLRDKLYTIKNVCQNPGGFGRTIDQLAELILTIIADPF